MSELSEAIRKYRRKQMSHPSYRPVEREKAWNDVKSTVLPQSPAEAAMMLALGPIGGKAFKGAALTAGAMASDDAEAAFIGPKGIERLRKLNKDVETWPSRFFGERAEVNPTNAANVLWRMGDPGHTLDNLIKQGKTSVLMKDILPPGQFQDLADAYPEIFNMPVSIKPSPYQESLAASYRPLKKSDIVKRREKVENYLLERYARTHPYPPRSGVYQRDQYALNDWNDDYLAYRSEKLNSPDNNVFDNTLSFNDLSLSLEDRLYDKTRKRTPGLMTLNVPDQSTADNPSLDFINSILHEAQHAIQDIEHPPGFENLLPLYNKSMQNISNNARSALSRKLQTGVDPSYYTDPNFGVHLVEFLDNVNDTKVRNWMDALTTKEKAIIDPWRDNLWWPPSSRDMNNLRQLLEINDKDPLNASMLNDLDNLDFQFSTYSDPLTEQSYVYKMNPYEREAVEAARRDTDPQYRRMYSRKTENLDPDRMERRIQKAIQDEELF